MFCEAGTIVTLDRARRKGLYSTVAVYSILGYRSKTSPPFSCFDFANYREIKFATKTRDQQSSSSGRPRSSLESAVHFLRRTEIVEVREVNPIPLAVIIVKRDKRKTRTKASNRLGRKEFRIKKKEMNERET